MNALSALRSLAYPALRPAAAAQPTAENPTPKPIPFTELEKISPGILPLPPGGMEAAPTTSFDGLLKTFVGEVNEKQAAARDTVQALLSGQNVSLHQAMIGMEEAAVSFQLMVEVRNRLLESYQELMRMQI
jgi:flagellar hook-basal body complex protein FliE